jgi:uncharacterized protein YdeI (YjbR/CyaY-like superfamily)
MKPIFFAAPVDWRHWLEKHHDLEKEVLLGFYKRDSGKPGITWPESVDVALCFGWIDGVRRSIDDTSYTIRFTPRRPRSIWSRVNTKRVAELINQGLMHSSGMKGFEARDENRSGIYAFERQHAAFDRKQEAQFRTHKAAWKFFQAQPPWYRRTTTHWVVSAKREETRDRRLAIVLADSEAGRTIGPLTRPQQKHNKPKAK